LIAVIAAAAASTWTAVLIAALGSSAIGAIVGGYMTTRMRGRFEREEAWRTRLITAADDLNNTLVQALWALGSLLPSVARGERRLRNDDGTLTEEATTSIKSLRDLQDQAEVALVRVELLYSSSSAVYQHALEVRRLIGSSISAAECRPRAVNLIKAVLAERETGGPDSICLQSRLMRTLTCSRCLSGARLPRRLIRRKMRTWRGGPVRCMERP
jgi:hypothetical protein